ncbi:MAG: FAD-dependent oxidoreductase, partial [Proteobacteria bacterium]|nr:FAD-dependent oxidoreductase [Pseudomonadota bacterium]
NSDQVLNIPAIPKHLAIIGGGVIGLEFASLFGMMGSQVTIVEAMDRLVSDFDRDCVKELIKCWRSHKIAIHTNTTLEDLSMTKNKVTLTIKTKDTGGQNGDDQQKVTCDAVLFAVGRLPETSGLGLEHVAVATDDQGFIMVNEHLQTKSQGIYAVGDVISTPSLAHTATAEAHYVIDHMTKTPANPIDYLNNPLAIYTYPELARVGYKEEELQAMKTPYKVSRFPFSVMAKAMIEGYPEGFIKLLSHQETGEILGVHLIGGRVTEMVSEFTLGKVLETTIFEFAHTIRPHPTLSETLSEVAYQAMGEPLHAP